MKKIGDLVVLSGPSGVGKSTLVNALRKRLPELEFSVSCTTRQPRPGETDGREYYFLSDEEFLKRLERKEFVESAQIFRHRYGTLKSEVLERVRRGAQVVLDIDIQGARQIRVAAQSDPELLAAAVFVLIAPPSLAVLEERLRGRATESEEQLALRLGGAKNELAGFRTYDYVVVNDSVERATDQLFALFQSFRLRCSTIVGDPFHE